MTEQPATMLPALTGACACGGRFAVAGSVAVAGDGTALRSSPGGVSARPASSGDAA